MLTATNGWRMADEWLTYLQAGERLGISAEAARQRAIRGAWPRRISNEGTALIRLPQGVEHPVRTPNKHPSNGRRTGGRTAVERPDEQVDMRIRLAAAEAELTALRDHLLDLRQERDRLIADVDHWRRLADQRRPAAEGVTAIMTRLRAKAS